MEISWKGAVLALAGVSLIGLALRKELRRPPGERTWHGRLAGKVPYDFRPPTLGRLKANMWNPDDSRILTDKTFGVGWDVNFGAVARKAGLLAA